MVVLHTITFLFECEITDKQFHEVFKPTRHSDAKNLLLTVFHNPVPRTLPTVHSLPNQTYQIQLSYFVSISKCVHYFIKNEFGWLQEQGSGNTVLTQGSRFREMGERVLNPKQVSLPLAAYFIDACSLGKSMPHILYILTVTFSGLHNTATAVSRFKQGYLEHIGYNALIHTKSNWESSKSIWECPGSSGTHSQPFSLSRSINLGGIHP